MAKIKILIADNSFLIREGLRSILASNDCFNYVGEAENTDELNRQLCIHQPHVLIMDYTSPNFCIDDVLIIHEQYPLVNILAITNPQSKKTISQAIENGVVSHLLKDCDREEIIESIYSTEKGQKFFCGKILDAILKEKDTLTTSKNTLPESVSCDGIKLSAREIEIIQNVAAGHSNKEIAERLFLSVHTVTTHRKNIMSKLGVNNTAGLMMYAIRQNLIEPNKFLFDSN